jgi:restriction system protein
MASSRTASVEFELRRREQEQAAAEARREQRVLRKAAAERATAQYHADRAADARRRTRELDERVAELRGVLARGLRRTAGLDLDGLRRQVVLPPLDLSHVGWAAAPPDWGRYEPAPPTGIGRLVGRGRYERSVAAARAAYEEAVDAHARAEADRQRRFAEARARHRGQVAAARQRVSEHNRTVDGFAAALRARDPEAICHHLELVLDMVPLPRRFPRGLAVGWDGDRPAVRFALPGPEVVPGALAIRYNRDDDELHVLPRPYEEAAELYRLVLGQVVLLCLRDAFAADAALEAIRFDGEVRGRTVVSARVRRSALEGLDLAHATLDQLGALVSARPYELEPIAG